MSELVFLFSADADIQTAYEFYEAYQEGRGEVFMRHLDVALGRLRTFPEIAPPHPRGSPAFARSWVSLRHLLHA